MQIKKLNIPPFTLLGVSVAGVQTCLLIKELGLCFDVAQGLSFAVPAKTFFITHSHLDHAAGIPYVISQRGMASIKQSIFYMPASMTSPLRRIMQTWEELDQHEYSYEFRASEIGDKIFINNNYFVSPFETIHRVPSLGYGLWEKKYKLRSEYQNLPPNTIKELAHKGELVQDEVIRPIFCVTGDTQIEVLDKNPFLYQSKYLFIESTYLDEARPRQRARDWGHIHLDEIAERAHLFKNEKVILGHVSGRYSAAEAQKHLAEKIPQEYLGRVQLF